MQNLQQIHDELVALRSTISQKTEQQYQKIPQTADIKIELSCRNLLDYLNLREQDLVELQDRLMKAGLASLSRLEPGVMTTLNAMIELLHHATCTVDQGIVCEANPFQNLENEKILKERSLQLFGSNASNRSANIMVTLPTEAAWNENLVRELLKQGMDLARINTAHDDQEIWTSMVNQIRRQSQELHLNCKIMVDLTGPKLRTGELNFEPSALHLKVKRDLFGRTTEPGKIILYRDDIELSQLPQELNDHQPIPMPVEILQQLKSGDKLNFKDSRKKSREIVLVETYSQIYWTAMCFKPAYLPPNCEISWVRKHKKNHYKVMKKFVLSHLAGTRVNLRLYNGDIIYLTKSQEPADWIEIRLNGQLQRAAKISCQTPKPIDNLSIGDPVWFDDGKLGSKMIGAYKAGVLLQVVEAGLGGVKLKSDKGINFPETDLGINGLSDEDIENLDWVAKHADLVGLSFAQTVEDVEMLIEALQERGREQMPFLAKIETAQGVHNLPEILLKTLSRNPLGVMIARGDLAVELGSVRMAAMQEEILSLCEAAQVPVVWATQVLETLAKKGVTSRPELTDAATSVRSECVMLNKGPYITEAVRVLSNILSNMEHQTHKKVSLLKPIKWTDM